MQPWLVRGTHTNISALIADYKRSDLILFIVIFVITLGITLLSVLAGTQIGFTIVLAILAALIAAALVVLWPAVGFFVVVGCAVVVEEAPLLTPIFTDRLNVYYWPPNLAGLIERPIGFLILFIFLVLICHRLINRQQPLRGGKLLWPYLFFLLCVAAGVLHGLASGGNFKIIVLEVRPFWYLFVSYLLAYNLVESKSHIRLFFWIAILGAGVKALQGLYIYLILFHGNLEGHNEIMAHEESFFFAALLLLVILFCLHYRYRPQLYAALLVSPVVLIALFANQRRADFLALLVGGIVAWAITLWVKPRARTALIVGMLVFLALGTGYVIAFSHSTGTIAEPARAIISIINPKLADARDASSNLYRTIEDFDLKFTVKQNPLLGLGFGKQFLQPMPLPDISESDPLYVYVPHNTIYWVWMRLGPVGYLALWYLFGAFIVRGCLIARQLKDRYLQLVAIYIVAVTFMEVVVAFADYQLFFYRNVIYLGLLIGILMKLPSIDEKTRQLSNEDTRSVPALPVPDMGLQRA
jgi:O-Antigen ligase